MKVNVTHLESLVQQGYLTKRKHPELPLWIYNYSAKAQYERYWTPETRMCRGLVTDEQGEVQGRSFEKFFNLEEEKRSALPMNAPITVTEKMDGSLGIVFSYQGRNVFATRGSFDSPQAHALQELWEERYGTEPVPEGLTHLFEIIVPENRIVVDYGETRELYYITSIHTATGMDMPIKFHPRVKQYECNSFADLELFVAQQPVANREGFVIAYRHSGKTCRVKVKFEEYKRLHRLVTGCSTKSIWEALRYGHNLDELLERVPDEFYRWVKTQINQLQGQFVYLLEIAREFVDANVRPLPTRKEQAASVLEFCRPHHENALLDKYNISGVMFSLLDGKDPSDMLWRMLEPEYERPALFSSWSHEEEA